MAQQPVNMALSKKEAKSSMGMMASPGDTPRFPWGLSITLDTKSLEKLKMADLPNVGSYVTVTAYCCVKSVRESAQVDGDKDRSVELQIEEMNLAPSAAKRGKAVGKGYKKTMKSDDDGDE